MSMTPVTITTRANDWDMVNQALACYYVECLNDSKPVEAKRAHAMMVYINKRLEESK